VTRTIKNFIRQTQQKKPIGRNGNKEDNIKIEVSEWERTVNRNGWLKMATADDGL